MTRHVFIKRKYLKQLLRERERERERERARAKKSDVELNQRNHLLTYSMEQSPS
jgi:hypothetical protein